MSTRRRWVSGILVALAAVGVSLSISGRVWAEDPIEFFEAKVRPILVERCQSCHGSEKQKGGLRLDSKPALLRGGDSGPAAVAGQLEDSLLVEAIRYDSDLKMPPRSRLPDREIATLQRWVELGLPWPEPKEVAALTTPGAFDLAARREDHWAWQAVRRPEPPPVHNASWPRSPIDRFLLAQLEAHNLRPAADADRRALIRRLTFDLIGLPPDPGEVEAFLNDPQPDAYDRLVDRLLASPHFGERWARHWLDLVRYAETRGHEFDPEIPNAYQYRDYLIRAFNADVPYDRVVREHIAGDLLAEPRRHPTRGHDESILGTGFWFLGEEVHSPVDIRQDETDRMDNRLDVFGKAFLGLTVACARCHDHKFDAISQRDYYALAGFLESSSYRQVRFETRGKEREIAGALEELSDQARRRLLPLAARARRPVLDRLADVLLAARELIREGVPGQPDAARGVAIAQSAARHGLEPSWLTRWLAELVTARDDPRHVLHAFAVHDPRAVATPVSQLAGTTGRPYRVILDYAATGSGDWIADGYAFGLRPLRPGDVRFVGEPGRPLVEVIDRAAAYRDPAWLSLPRASSAERDHGKLGTWDRSGQTIRTPEFTLESGQLWYLVRGSVRAYAAVNAHLVIAGPLHGALLGEWKSEEDWHWVRHDLSSYAGHRLHLEFSPGGTGPMAVAAVVESSVQPTWIDPADEVAAAVTASGTITDAQSLARAYQAACLDASDRLAANALCGREPESRVAATLARWISARPDLFEQPDEALRVGLDEVLKRQAALTSSIPAVSPTAPALLDGNGVDEFVLIRGNSRTPGPPVPRRFLEAIAGPDPIDADPSTSGRLALADLVASADNPLTARVLVNRVWHHLFGRGIVATVDNFGVLGDRPSHPELLDFLADQFVRDGWSLKRLIRSLVTTRAYQMASRADEASDRADPDDVLLHRMRVRRLEAEAIRDTILSVSGQLDRAAFGPSIPLHLTSFMQGRGRPGTSGPLDGAGRRSLYIEIRRNFLSPMLQAFDAPIPFSTMGRRNLSNVPAQALILLNDPFVIEQAQCWARRTLAEPGLSTEQRITGMYRAAFGRDPEPDETAEARAFLTAQTRELGDELPAWADLAHVLFNSKEFLFRP